MKVQKMWSLQTKTTKQMCTLLLILMPLVLWLPIKWRRNLLLIMMHPLLKLLHAKTAKRRHQLRILMHLLLQQLLLFRLLLLPLFLLRL